jgi:chromate transporter
MKILRLVIIGLIAAAAMLLITPESFGEGYGDWKAWFIFIAAFVSTKWLKLNPILMIFIAAVIGVIIY